jgi:hypothetical protein
VKKLKKPVKKLFIFFTVLKTVNFFFFTVLKTVNFYFLHCFLIFSSFPTLSNLYLLFFTVFQCKKGVSKNKRTKYAIFE